MSWLNDSLNKVKGTISSFAQDVLEGPISEDENNPGSSVIDKQEVEVLKNLCATQDNEIATLRRQIVEYQQQQTQQQLQQQQQQQQQFGNNQTNKLTETAGTSSKNLSDAPLEDSWFWDPDNNTISSTTSSSKKDENDSPIGGDLTTIPLDNVTSETDLIDRLNRQNADKEQKLKRVLLENAILNEKLGQINNENRELNSNLEELDKQHNLALDKLLSVKNSLQTDYNKLKDDLVEMQKQSIAKEYEKVQEINKCKEDIEHLSKSATETGKKYDKLEKSFVSATQSNLQLQNEIDALKEEMKKIVCENVESSLLYEAKEQELNLNYDNFIGEKCKLEANFNDLKKKYDELLALNAEQTQAKSVPDDSAQDIISSLQKQLEQMSVEKRQWEQDFIALQDDNLDLQREFSAYKADVIKAKHAAPARDQDDFEVDELKAKVEQLSTERRQWEEDFIALQDSNLELQREYNNYKASIVSAGSSQSAARDAFDDEATIEQLNARIEELTAENSRMEEEFCALQDNNIDIKREFQEYKSISSPDANNELITELQAIIKQITEEKRKWEEDFTALQVQTTSSSSGSDNNSQLVAQLNAQIEQLKVEKYQCEVDFNVLQDDNLVLQREFSAYKAEVIQNKSTQSSNSEEIAELQQRVEELMAEKVKLEENCTALYVKNTASEAVRHDDDEALKAAKRKAEEELAALQESHKQVQNELSAMRINYDNLVSQNSNAGDLSAKFADLTIEKQTLEQAFNNLKISNLDLQQELNKLTTEMSEIRLEHSTMKTQSAGVSPDERTLSNPEVRELLKRYFNYEPAAGLENYLEDFLQKFKDVHSKLTALEKNLIESSALCNSLKVEKEDLVQERDNLKSDLVHYELECADLSKNNDLLITEIENLKCSKLETINENCEDSIVSLEKQLEDSTNINQNLEVEYEELQENFEKCEAARKALEERVSALDQQIVEFKNNQKQFKIQIDVLENEKSNLLFEINELSVNDQSAVLDETKQSHEREIVNLQQQLASISQEHSQLLEQHQQQQLQAAENIKRLEELIQSKDNLVTQTEEARRALDEQLQHRASELGELRNIVTQLEASKAAARNELDEERIKSNNYLAEMKKYQEKLLESSNDEKYVAEMNAMKATIDSMIKEKNDIIALITVKHNENIQYHQEIQRLNQLLYLEIEKTKNFSCGNCLNLQNELAQLQQSAVASSEVEKLNDQIQFLREKSDILTQNLVAEQANQKLYNQEKLELMEQKNDLVRDLDRLRQHLLEIEEAHTQETVELQKVIDETKTKLFALESDAKQTSTAYTSASIRANQQAETLQAQYMLLSQQRDELLAKLSLADDTQLKNQAALTNLQCALEQFQRNKEKDIETANHIIRKELENERIHQHNLMKDMQVLQQQLTEAKNGLLAAARISDQLEISQVTIAQLKDELTKSEEKYATLEKKLHDTETSQVEKVEKNLVKNLVIGYVVAPNQNDKIQILKLISAVLTLDQNECDKVGLNRSQSGWLSSILTGGTNANNQNANYNKESLAQAFVQFLEKESQPRNNGPQLLNLMTRVTREDLSSTPTVTTSIAPAVSSANSGASNITNTVPAAASTQQPIQPILLNDSILQQSFVPPRNSSSILKDILYDS